MTTYTLHGYATSQVSTTSGNLSAGFGDIWRLDPLWDNSEDHLAYTITDDDSAFNGDSNTDESGNDASQSVVVTNADGNTVATGQIYLESHFTLSDGDGHLVEVYTVEINGREIGIVTVPEMVPGVAYEITGIENVIDTNAPDYASLAWPTYDPDLAQTYNGGAFDDEIVAGDGDDTVSGGAGDDAIYGGDGEDTLSGGAGTDSLSGGSGNDTFMVVETDEVTNLYGDGWWDIASFKEDETSSGVDITYTGATSFTYEYNATAANGTAESIEQIDGTYGADIIDATANTHDSIYSTLDGDDVVLGGSGDEDIYTGDGDDAITGGAGDDTLYGEGDRDVFYFDNAWGNDTVFGGSGGDDEDTLDFSNVTTDITVTYTGSENGGVTSGADSVTFKNIEVIIGGSGADIIDASADGSGLALDGGGGADIITGGSDNDIITGGAGDDTITTGADEDTVVLADGFGHDTITDFDLTDSDGDGFTDDQFDVSSLTDADGNPVDTRDVSVSEDSEGNAVLTFPNGESITLEGVAPSQVDSAPELHAMGIPCFVSGTRIMTPSGERLIEDLQCGDVVSTLTAGPQPILWVGRTTVTRARLALQPELSPIRVRAGTIGNSGDLWVSPQHGLALPDHSHHAEARVLVRARHLLEYGDGRVRRAQGCRDVTYHHLLLPQHALILANGCASESLFPGRYALSGFDRAAKAELFDLFPALETILMTGAPTTSAVRMYGETVLRFAKGRDLRAGHVRLPARGGSLG
ncbi:Hint domain-containing protein [Celeribacter sp.]|uniref:Hint domain-containing protein n=1 Tax=Celeribacter sp. TaxID=1890673 RepID=UPI003A95894C